jgi:hypothetical protein
MKILFPVLAGFLFCATQAAKAQWHEINLPFANSILKIYPYFLDSNIGFIWTSESGSIYKTKDGGITWSNPIQVSFQSINQLYFVNKARGFAACQDRIAKTTDSGMSWRTTSSPRYEYASVYAVKNAVFAVASSKPSKLLVYSLNDGATWQTIPLGPQMQRPNITNVIGNRDSLIVTKLQSQNDEQLVYSSDLGNTWHNVNVPFTSSSQNIGFDGPLFSFPHSCDVIQQQGYLDALITDEYLFQRATLPYSHWDSLFREETGAWIGGNKCAIYACNARPSGQPGVFRSTDRGASWQFVSGPDNTEIDDFDYQNISVVGYGAVAYVTENEDIHGLPKRLWKTSNGGDGRLQSSSLGPKYGLDPKLSPKDSVWISDCDSGSITLTNQSCSFASIVSIKIDGIDSTEFHVSRRHAYCSGASDTVEIFFWPLNAGSQDITIHIMSEDDEYALSEAVIPLSLLSSGERSRVCCLFPLGIEPFGPIRACSSSFSLVRLCPNKFELDSIGLIQDTEHFRLEWRGIKDSLQLKADSLFVVFSPNHHSGLFSGGLHLVGKIRFKEVLYPLDTIIYFSATSLPEDPSIIPRTALFHFDSVSNCSSGADTVLVLTNKSCGADTVIGVDPIGNGFSIITDPIPIIIPQDSTTAVKIHFSTAGTGIFLAASAIHVRSMGLIEDISLTMHASATRRSAILTIPQLSIQAGSFSYCKGDTILEATVANSGCDTLVLNNIRIAEDGTFSLVSKPTDSLLRPNESTSFKFAFAPRVKGRHQATLTFHSRNLHGNDQGHDTTITLTGLGLDGDKLLSSSLAVADLGRMHPCDSKDTIFWLKNTGCDTLTITDGSFSNGSFVGSATYPIAIPPHDSTMIIVHVDTAGSNGASTISGVYSAHSDGGAVSVPLTVSIIPPVHILLELLKPDSTKAGGKVTYILRVVGAHPTNLFSAFHFDLTHDDDLLSFESMSGAGLSVATEPPQNRMTTQHFTLLPVPLTDTIGWLNFRAYLSKESMTALSISQFTFSAPRASDCIATLSEAGSNFTYIYSCGEHFMQNVLSGTPFSIESVVPNPAREEMEVRVSGAGFRVSGVEVELCDVLGRPVLTQHVAPDTQHLNIRTLPSGVYNLRVSQGGFVQSRRVVIAR